MEEKLEQTLATVDRVFKVELMKMPPALQKTLMIDLINGAVFKCILMFFLEGIHVDFI